MAFTTKRTDSAALNKKNRKNLTQLQKLSGKINGETEEMRIKTDIFVVNMENLQKKETALEKSLKKQSDVHNKNLNREEDTSKENQEKLHKRKNELSASKTSSKSFSPKYNYKLLKLTYDEFKENFRHARTDAKELRKYHEISTNNKAERKKVEGDKLEKIEDFSKDLSKLKKEVKQDNSKVVKEFAKIFDKVRHPTNALILHERLDDKIAKLNNSKLNLSKLSEKIDLKSDTGKKVIQRAEKINQNIDAAVSALGEMRTNLESSLLKNASGKNVNELKNDYRNLKNADNNVKDLNNKKEMAEKAYSKGRSLIRSRIGFPNDNDKKLIGNKNEIEEKLKGAEESKGAALEKYEVNFNFDNYKTYMKSFTKKGEVANEIVKNFEKTAKAIGKKVEGEIGETIAELYNGPLPATPSVAPEDSIEESLDELKYDGWIYSTSLPEIPTEQKKTLAYQISEIDRAYSSKDLNQIIKVELKLEKILEESDLDPNIKEAKQKEIETIKGLKDVNKELLLDILGSEEKYNEIVDKYKQGEMEKSTLPKIEEEVLQAVEKAAKSATDVLKENNINLKGDFKSLVESASEKKRPLVGHYKSPDLTIVYEPLAPPPSHTYTPAPALQGQSIAKTGNTLKPTNNGTQRFRSETLPEIVGGFGHKSLIKDQLKQVLNDTKKEFATELYEMPGLIVSEIDNIKKNDSGILTESQLEKLEIIEKKAKALSPKFSRSNSSPPAFNRNHNNFSNAQSQLNGYASTLDKAYNIITPQDSGYDSVNDSQRIEPDYVGMPDRREHNLKNFNEITRQDDGSKKQNVLKRAMSEGSSLASQSTRKADRGSQNLGTIRPSDSPDPPVGSMNRSK